MTLKLANNMMKSHLNSNKGKILVTMHMHNFFFENR